MAHCRRVGSSDFRGINDLFFRYQTRRKMFPHESENSSATRIGKRHLKNKAMPTLPPDLPYDKPWSDYAGYFIKNPHSEYAARNLPRTNDPDEIQGRKWQAIEEQSFQRAPRTFGDVNYWRWRGRDWEESQKRVEEIGPEAYQNEKRGEMIVVLILSAIIFLAIWANGCEGL